jgi:predicted exporter
MDAAGQKAWGEFFWQHRNGLIASASADRFAALYR